MSSKGPVPDLEQGLRPTWLWMGPVVGEQEMLAGPALSPAANRWQTGLLRALSDLGIDIQVASYVPDRSWPKGPLRKVGTARSPVTGLQITTLAYLNVSGLRQASLARAHRNHLRELLATGPRPSVILTYNAPEGPARAALEMQDALGIPWIAVVCDVDGQSSPRAVEAYLERVHRATGRVVLAWSAYQDQVSAPKIHLDGGVTRVRPRSKAPPGRSLLYTGMLGKHGGIEMLLEAFQSMSDPRAELWICGKLPSEEFLRRVGEDRRVRYYGAVGEAELEDLSDRAAVFVNPRPAEITESSFNFPSKILEYLSYGKPVVSTWTPGLAPEYRDVLIVPDEPRPGALARTLEHVLDWPEGDREDYRHRVSAFLEGKRLWSVQARRLRGWVEGITSTGTRASG